MDVFKIGLFADGNVGYELSKFIIHNHIEDLEFLCITSEESPLFQAVLDLGFSKEKIYTYSYVLEHIDAFSSKNMDYFILAWWPYIIKNNIIKAPKIGVLNLHPSLLPYNKGKHPTFWNIIEEVPYGVTIHFVNEGIDQGEIVFQKEISKTWEDTGETLYNKSTAEMVRLFIQNYNKIKNKDYIAIKQQNVGSFHYSKEMSNKLEVKLDERVSARELFNLLRAKDFPNSPQCYFHDGNNKFEVKISIKDIGS